MLEFCIKLYKDAFTFVFDDVLNGIVFENGVSVWNIMLVTFVAGGLISMVMRYFGATGITKGATDAIYRIRNQEE